MFFATTFTNLSIYLLTLSCLSHCFSEFERINLRNEAREMFNHAYESYMKNAYPADELMPLSCKGRFRDIEVNRGDVDDALGNFSLTLIDTLDTLVLLGNYSEFEKSVYRVIEDVTFDSDIVVSVFETNIRVVGGLLSAHVLAQHLKNKFSLMEWYDSQLLDMAQDIGYRLLPAFNTSTGIPHPRINLKYGLNSSKIGSLRETCTSCAGTMILEFAALSRLTGDPVFEAKARKAMDYLWQQRHRQSDLVGNIINIHTGDWIRKESGVGAGIDSYYEYCLKAYILLGDENYLHRFNRHYAGIMKYVSQGPLLIDVHMHRPNNPAKNFMDSLLAFWPGLQVLIGDLKPAIETHEILYQVTQKHKFLPEAFTVDFNVHWPHHPLRPEFIESTYFLYQATNDDHYLEVGKEVLLSLQNYTRVHCGFAAVNDVRTKKKEDRMDSFFLAETLKYLYLLFSKKSEIELNLDEYIFTTEAHLLPLSLSDFNNTYKSLSKPIRRNPYFVSSSDYFCPTTKEFAKKINTYKQFDNLHYYKVIRKNVKNFVVKPNTFSRRKSNRVPRIRATEFSAMKHDHVDLVKKLGISVIVLQDGRVQLIHNSAAAHSQEDAEEGAVFMQEMISLSQQQIEEEQKLRKVSFTKIDRANSKELQISLLAGPAQFGLDINVFGDTVDGQVVIADPIDACNIEKLDGDIEKKIVLVQRGNCMFIEKARNVQKLGATGLIVFDNAANTSSKTMPMFAMSGDGSTDVTIPSVFLYSEDANILMTEMKHNPKLKVKLNAHIENKSNLNEEHYDKHSEKQLFNSGENSIRNIDSGKASVSNDYLADLANIFNVFKSDKLKFDLISSLNLKELNAENVQQFMSLIKNIASPNLPSKPMPSKSKKPTGCLNPYRKSESFKAYMLSLISTCMV